MITRKGDKLGMAERILTEIGKEHGFEVVASKDGRMFEPDKIGQWDAFVFETTGDLTTPGGDKNPPDLGRRREGVLRRDPGRQGIHGDALRDRHVRPHRPAEQGRRRPVYPDDRRRVHRPWCPAAVTDRDRRPGVPRHRQGFRHAGTSFTITDEWYALKNFADDLHVILVQVTEGMKGHMYERPNFPITWARPYGKGRVFYTSMGHREDVWENPMYQALLLGALGWTTGRIEASIEPNIRQVTPKYDELPK